MLKHPEKMMIIGAGQMGTELAALAVSAGYTVLLHDRQSSRVQQGLQEVNRLLSLKENDAENSEKGSSAIKGTMKVQDCVHCNFILEAVTENPTVKKQLFNTVANCITTETVLATTTSSLSVTDIASATDCPERVVGLHFLNPVSSVALVELIRGVQTNEETVTRAGAFAGLLGKEAIEVKDYPGFISNRLLMPMINEAIACVFDGIADAATIDRIMQLGGNHSMGPLKMADMIGLDTCLTVMETLHRTLDNRKYRPCTLLRNMVKAGKLGYKSGEGFYSYHN